MNKYTKNLLELLGWGIIIACVLLCLAFIASTARAEDARDDNQLPVPDRRPDVSYRQNGNMWLGDDGSSTIVQPNGDTINSDGTACRKIGNTVMCN